MPKNLYIETTVPDFSSFEDEDLPPVPNFIGPFRIVGLLNRGGMSILYLGIHPEKFEPIVIKILLPKFLQHKEMTGSFLREAEIIRIADHPNIVKLHSQGKWANGLYIAMEFIKGISLKQFIMKKMLTSRSALGIISQIASALSHLHSNGIIHRDLKPANILISEQGLVKVIDFGIAQLLGKKNNRKMGTPAYMSPEQKESKERLSFSSDIYSLGVITYELLVGKFSQGKIHLSLLKPPIRTILEKALRLQPHERYPTMSAFIEDLRNLSAKSYGKS